MHFVFLTLENYTLIALSSAIEVLRMANRIVGDNDYTWQLCTLDGHPARSSAGMQLGPVQRLDACEHAEIVFVCGGMNIQKAVTPNVLQALRYLDYHGVALGSLCTGSYALARAGLLKDHKAVIHWENTPALHEEFHDIELSDHLFVIDRKRYTCTGGVAPMDLFLHLVRKKHGREVAQKITDQFIVERMRSAIDKQHVPLSARAGGYHQNLIEAAALMEANIEDPLSLDEVARLVGVSRRQIERLFKRHIGKVPARYYLELRLARAQQLLSQTTMSIVDVATACGFQSLPHFSRCYRSHHGRNPTSERRAQVQQA